jgi:hypothetical protein
MPTVPQMILSFCLLVDVEPSKERVALTAQMLQRKFSDEQIKKALAELAYTHKFFPDVATITEAIQGREIARDISEITTNAILQAASNFSMYDVKGARQHLGEETWAIVERFGGFESLTRLTYDEITSTRAQLRNFVKSNVKNGVLSVGNIVNGKLEHNTTSGLAKINFKLEQ